METKNWLEIADEIKKDKSINFIGRAISPLHVLGIEAFILYLKRNGVNPRGFILAVSHESTGMTITEELFHPDMYEGVTPVFLDSSEGLRLELGELSDIPKRKSATKTFYFANPYRVEFDFVSTIAKIRKEERIEVVLTDEGGASYLDNPYSYRLNKSYDWSIKDSLRFILYSCIRDNLLSRWSKSKGFVNQFLMLKKQNGKWVGNEPCIESFLELLRSKNFGDDYSDYEDAVLICPSLIYEAEILKEECDIDIFKSARDKLGDLKCIVKPHPREKNIERYNRLNCVVERRYSVTTEEILANLTKLPKCIIGESSTILFSAAALFGVKAVSINKLIDRNCLSDRTYFDSFNENFDDIVCIPNTKEELYKVLEEL